MNHTAFVLRCSAVILAGTITGISQSAITPVGVWRGSLDGQPGVTLTLADDTGEVGGTIVFNAVNSDHQVVENEPHLLLHPKLTGKTLSFQVRRTRGGSGFFDLQVVFTTDSKAQLRCANCGSQTPVTELVKEL